jgi:hypothetical protein
LGFEKYNLFLIHDQYRSQGQTMQTNGKFGANTQQIGCKQAGNSQQTRGNFAANLR